MNKFLALSLILTVFTSAELIHAKEAHFSAQRTTSGEGRTSPKGYMTPEADAEEAADEACIEAIETCQKATGQDCVETKRVIQYMQPGYSLSPAEITCTAVISRETGELKASGDRFWRQLLGGQP